MSWLRRRMARVSKKTRPRRRPTTAEEPGTLVERMVGSLWRAVAAGDLLRAELDAATCMALPRVGRLAPEDVQPGPGPADRRRHLPAGLGDRGRQGGPGPGLAPVRRVRRRRGYRGDVP